MVFSKKTTQEIKLNETAEQIANIEYQNLVKIAEILKEIADLAGKARNPADYPTLRPAIKDRIFQLWEKLNIALKAMEYGDKLMQASFALEKKFKFGGEAKAVRKMAIILTKDIFNNLNEQLKHRYPLLQMRASGQNFKEIQTMAENMRTHIGTIAQYVLKLKQLEARIEEFYRRNKM